MQKNYSYQDCYKVLNVRPECTWAELRSAYRKLIQKWHPDRFEDGSKEKIAAENKIKSLNIAYKHIQNYYRQKGKLPLVDNNIKAKPKVTQPSNPAPSKATPNKSNIDKNVAANASVQNNISDKQSKITDKKFSKRFVVTFSLILLVSSYYFFTTNSENEAHYNPDAKPPKLITNPGINTQELPSGISSGTTRFLKDNLSQPSPYKTSPRGEKILDKNDFIDNNYFTSGSTISDVIGIQGAPSKTEGDVWFYGKSEVYFVEGKVSHWVRHADDPLKVRRKLDNLE